MTKLIKLLLLTVILNAVFISHASLSHAQLFSNKFDKQQKKLLKSDEAFKFSAKVTANNKLQVLWTIADDYYMYHDTFKVTSNAAQIAIGELDIPTGKIVDDPEFGETEVYFSSVLVGADLIQQANNGSEKTTQIDLTVYGQGCNKPVGICYPPIKKVISLDLNDVVAASNGTSNTVSNEASINNESDTKKSYFSYLLAAFGAGLLLSLTPCVLPMIPILAGIITGQKQTSKYQSGWLSICYVAGTVVTYIIAGAVAGATGAQLQAYFQNAWVIGGVCIVLGLLALSLFGAFKIALPAGLQTRLQSYQPSARSAAITSFALGLISALVIGACVSPVLILALGTAISQSDPVLGASIMGMMAFGMGVLLIAFGFGAGWLLPKTGAWMQQVQIIFGFTVVATILYLLSGLANTLIGTYILFLWASLLLCAGFYIWQLCANFKSMLGQSVFKSIASGLIIWGALSFIGAFNGGDNVLQPLQSLQTTTLSRAGAVAPDKLDFKTVTTLEQTTELLEQAQKNQQAVILDFYADWCTECIRMHRTTFINPDVVQALNGWMLIEVDVTNTSKDSEEIKRHFNIFGPPATLFFNKTAQELTQLRQYGYIKSKAFLSLVNRTIGSQSHD